MNLIEKEKKNKIVFASISDLVKGKNNSRNNVGLYV